MIKTLLIGWDAADWKVISPLIEANLTLQIFTRNRGLRPRHPPNPPSRG